MCIFPWSISLLFFFFFFPLGRAHGTWKFWGQGSNLCHCSNLSHSSDNAESLTCWATRELHFSLFSKGGILQVLLLHFALFTEQHIWEWVHTDLPRPLQPHLLLCVDRAWFAACSYMGILVDSSALQLQTLQWCVTLRICIVGVYLFFFFLFMAAPMAYENTSSRDTCAISGGEGCSY